MIENIFDKNIFAKHIFLNKKIFFPIFFSPSHAAIHPLHTTPTPSYLLFEVGGGGRTNEGLTDRTHTRIVPFIVLDFIVYYTMQYVITLN